MEARISETEMLLAAPTSKFRGNLIATLGQLIISTLAVYVVISSAAQEPFWLIEWRQAIVQAGIGPLAIILQCVYVRSLFKLAASEKVSPFLFFCVLPWIAILGFYQCFALF